MLMSPFAATAEVVLPNGTSRAPPKSATRASGARRGSTAGCVVLRGFWEVCLDIMAGWWFQTFFIFHNVCDVILPIDFHMFQDG